MIMLAEIHFYIPNSGAEGVTWRLVEANTDKEVKVKVQELWKNSGVKIVSVLIHKTL